MDRRHLQAVLSRVGRAEPDAELLRRFTHGRDEDAFAELVARHGRLVWALCRNLLPSETDADDAFQATFLVLAKSAGSVRDAGRLGPWLYGVAYRVCLKARRAAARRKKHEHAAANGEAGRPVADSKWDAAMAAVHEEVGRLPEALRTAFVLCCLEGKGATEAAGQLGWKLGTLSGRLSRAKQALLARLEARGVTAAVAGAAALAAGANAAVPHALVDRTLDVALSGGVVPNTLITLSQGVSGMAISRTKLLAAALLVAGGLASGAGSGWLATADAQQPAKPTAKSDDPKRAEAARQLLVQEQLLARQRERIAELKKLTDAQRTRDAEERLTAELNALLADRARTDADDLRLVIRLDPAKAGEFHYVPQAAGAAPTRAEFEATVREQEQNGWRFVGVVPMKWEPRGVAGDGKNVKADTLPTFVFRRPTPEAQRHLLLDQLGVVLPPAAPPPPKVAVPLKTATKEAPADAAGQKRLADLALQYEYALRDRAVAAAKERQLLDQIKALEAELATLKGRPVGQTLAINPDSLGLAPGELVSILSTLAAKKFGKDWTTRLKIVDGEPPLRVEGDAEAVRWVKNVVDKLASVK